MVRNVFSWCICCLALLGCDSSTEPQQVNFAALSLSIVVGDAQADTVMSTLPQALRVVVLSEGNPAPGVLVNFMPGDDCGSVFAPAVLTNASGEASNRWTLGTLAGPCNLEARAINDLGQPVTFSKFTSTVLHGNFAQWGWYLRSAGIRTLGETAPLDVRPFLRVAGDQWGNSILVTDVHDVQPLSWSISNNVGGSPCINGDGEPVMGTEWDVAIPDLLALGYPIGHTVMNTGAKDTTYYWIAARIEWHAFDSQSGSITTFKQYIDQARCDNSTVAATAFQP